MGHPVDKDGNPSVWNGYSELERLRSLARHNEAAALANAERREREKWQGVVADISNALAAARAEIERLRSGERL